MSYIESINTALNLLVSYWWVYVPVVLFVGLVNIWSQYTRTKYTSSLKWVLLEIKIPKEVVTTFKATEQFFAALHGVYVKPLSWDEKFFDGKMPDWYSLEIIGTGSSIHFYVRTPEDYRNLVEANLYAQYPDAEIELVDDYTGDIDKVIPNESFDLWGMELELKKSSVYPLRTYPYFEDVAQIGRDKKIVDPLASLSEILGSLKPGEHIWIQFLISPTGDEWTKESEGELDKILGRDVVVAEGENKRDKQLSPGEKILAGSITDKISKLGFKTTLRFVYIGKKDIFSLANGAAISGAFKQFASQDRNGFRAVKKTIPKASWPGFIGKWPLKLIPYPGKKSEEYKKKRKLFRNFRGRSFGEKTFILNTEELATLFHLPSVEVRAPLLERIEAKKGTPPMGLPVEEE